MALGMFISNLLELAFANGLLAKLLKKRGHFYYDALFEPSYGEANLILTDMLMRLEDHILLL